MPSLVIPLDSVSGDHAPTVGSKAARLAALRGRGFPVPAGFCLAIDAFQQATARYSEAIAHVKAYANLLDPALAVQASGEIAQILVQLQVPPVLLEELARLMDQEAAQGLWAVRSSASAEDRPGASFAGQYASVLGVQSLQEMEQAILAVWRSFYSPHALAAQSHAGFLAPGEGMGVLVQQLVPAQLAGTCLTVDLVRIDRRQVVVSAAWGMGMTVAEGTGAADSTWVARDTELTVTRRHVADKKEQLILDNDRLQRLPVPEAKRRVACLPDPWAQRVAQLGLTVEAALGSPQEIEWAIDGQWSWLLQSRPLTNLPTVFPRLRSFPVRWPDPADGRLLWARSLWTERDNEVLLPLEQDFVQARVRGTGEGMIDYGLDTYWAIRFHNGRGYSCQKPNPQQPGDRRIRQRAMTALRVRLNGEGTTGWTLWGPEIVAATEKLDAFDGREATDEQVAAHLEDAFGVARRHWKLHGPNLFVQRTPLLAAYRRLTGDREATDDQVMRFVMGGESPLTELIDELYELGRLARECPAIVNLIRTTGPSQMAQLNAMPQAVPFLARFQAFLDRYGLRSGEGYGSRASMLTPTWRERPDLVLALVARYLEPGVQAPAAARAQAKAQMQAEVEALCARHADDPDAVVAFCRQLGVAQHTAFTLETHNHYIDQLSLGQARHAALMAGVRLERRGLLEGQEDVLWLHLEEIVAALCSEEALDLGGTVVARRRQHAQWLELEPPLFLGVPDPQLPPRPPGDGHAAAFEPAATGNRLIGLGASAGRYRGRARVIARQTLLPDLSPGDVLVTVNAGPSWTPYFPLLGAIVMDGGSIGQHAATTAREYGVPAVVQARRATQSIPDGAWVEVDGSAGVVTWEEAN